MKTVNESFENVEKLKYLEITVETKTAFTQKFRTSCPLLSWITKI